MEFMVVKEVYVKTGIIWANGSRCWVTSWGVMCLVMIIDQPLDRMNEYLLAILPCHVRVKILRLRSKDRPWFCRQYRVLYDEKQAAYHRWRRSRLREDYDSYVVTQIRAQRFLGFWWCDATLWGGCSTKFGRCRQPSQMVEDLEGVCLWCRAVCSYRQSSHIQ